MTAWLLAYDSYEAVMDLVCESKKSSSSDTLKTLDKWKNSQSHITSKPDFIKVVRWKMAWATFRPGLLQKIETNPEKDVEDSLQKAELVLKHDITWENVEKAINHLTKLYGIGPATASAILSISHHEIPFMSDESVMFCLKIDKRNIKYNIKTYKQVFLKLTEFAKTLNLDSSFEWTASKCERAVWTSLKGTCLGRDPIHLGIDIRKRDHDVNENDSTSVKRRK
jgi:hypothetical protein